MKKTETLEEFLERFAEPEWENFVSQADISQFINKTDVRLKAALKKFWESGFISGFLQAQKLHDFYRNKGGTQ